VGKGAAPSMGPSWFSKKKKGVGFNTPCQGKTSDKRGNGTV